MDSFETTLFQPDNYHLLSWPSPAARINQWKKPSGLDSPLSWLSKTRKSVVTSTIVLALTLGTNARKSSAVRTQERAATGDPRAIISLLRGYESIWLGLKEVGLGEKVAIFHQELTCSERGAVFTLNGTLENRYFTLNGQGWLSGGAETKDLTWTGNWLGTLGMTSIIFADDTGTFAFEETKGYIQQTFLQLGSLSSFPACQKLRAN